ncbi:hypothetical protein [Rhodanobacter denitrificans]|uniref:hypothetical protein n=1 Tax=Rhodanobacter denitrificans TaxID=666685 RepID=UPI001F46EFD6|nr:hypothetical protein [Rhodanobacter denitrificans]UJJ60573.1 hypothetical protein LRK55_19255 [Rhodanobacter denitrificans]
MSIEMSKTQGSVSWGAVRWAVVLGWPVVVAAVALRLAGLTGLSEELAERPRIAVMDVQAAVQASLRPGSTDKELQDAVARVQDAARRLRSAGYVVLDTSYVYAFPGEYEARLPEQEKAAGSAHEQHR